MRDRQINKLELQRAAGVLRARSEAVAGVKSVRLIQDIREMENVAQIIGKGALGPHFARSMNDISPGQMMVIVAYSEGGAPVGMVGARFDDKPGWDLRDFLSAHWERLYPGEAQGSFAQFSAGSSGYARDIFGPFNYIGDGWVAKEFRGGGLLGNIQKLLILLAYDEWKPRLTYGWMRPDKVLSGYAAKWGYSIVYPKGIEWSVPPEQKDLRDIYFVAADQCGIRQMLRDILCQDDANY